MSDSSNMLNYSVSTAQHIQKQNQGNDCPAVAPSVVNESSSTIAMLDHQTSSSSSIALDHVPTITPSATEDAAPVDPAAEIISSTEETNPSPVFSGKPIDNGHPESSHLINSSNSNQVILGQE